MIRLITEIGELDYARVEELGIAFHKEGKLPGSFKLGAFLSFWRAVLSQRLGSIWVAEVSDQTVGAIGALFSPDPNDGELVAAENFWFVDHRHRGGTVGIRLFREFERWGREVIRARRLLMGELIAIDNPKLSKFLKRQGYRAIERHLVREL
jgi:hypothetical protein